MPHNRERRNDDQEDPGQTHLNSDAKIAYEGRPQEAPLPIVFSRCYALGRAPTRGAPTDSPCPGEGAHKGCPYRFAMPWGGRPQGAPLPDSPCPGEGAHKGCPYRFAMPWGGRPQGAPLPDSPCPGEGAHKGCPYRFAMPWGGRPQGAPLPDSGGLTWVCPNLMQLPCKKTGLYYTKIRLVEG